MRHPLRGRRRLPWLLMSPWPILAGLSTAALGGWGAFAAANTAGALFFYQMFTPEALVAACGLGFRRPDALSPEMAQFLLHRTLPAFDCASIAVDRLGPPGFFHGMQLYMGISAAALWSVLGITQSSMLPLAAVFGAAYGAGGFVLARLFLPWPLAALAGTIIALSPVALTQVFLLRDFSKGPFFLWALVLLVLTLRARPGPAALACGVGAGLVVGVGFGFRSDLALLLPLGALVMIIAAQGSVLARFHPVAGFAAAFLVAASPILVQGLGSAAGFLAIQGATEPFRAFAMLRPAPYALGHAYLDELTLSGVAAAERPSRPGWDANEGQAGYQPSQAITLSTKHLLGWAPLFAADFMAQALKSTAWILGFPAMTAAGRLPPDPGGPVRLAVPAVQWQDPLFYGHLAQPWMPALGAAGVFAWLLLAASRSGREAAGLALLLVTLLAYPGIQFSTRHAFHLEFIWVIGLLSIPLALWRWRMLAPVFVSFAATTALALGAVGVLYMGLAQVQQRLLTKAFAELLAHPREPIAAVRQENPDGTILWRVPVPPEGQALIDAPPDAMTVRLPEVGIQHDVRAHANRMLLVLEGADCPQLPASVGLVYAHRPEVWQKLDSQISLAPGATAVFPAFYRGTQHFEGLQLPASHARCAVALTALPLTGPLPSVLTAVLPVNWHSLPLRKGLGGFGLRHEP
ncbi:MAG: hypothetical protein HEQ16_04560 [Bosea sp.]|nr:hypothetical protein [Bosea sp. (in: a-proteobacteria)]